MTLYELIINTSFFLNRQFLNSEIKFSQKCPLGNSQNNVAVKSEKLSVKSEKSEKLSMKSEKLSMKSEKLSVKSEK